jgi:hypothetical protein
VAYVDERSTLLPRLRKHAGGRALQDVLRLDGRSLRYHLGTSLADLRVPVSVAPSLREAFAAAVRDLFFLLCLRHRASLKESDFDQLLLLDGFDSKVARSPSFSAPASVQRDNVRRAFLEAPELHPALDAGLLASWIASGRPGRVLVGVYNAILRRAMSEAGEGQEPTPYLAVLALRPLADEVPGLLRKIPVSQATHRAFHGAVATGLLVAARLAAREAGAFDGPAGPLVETATQALACLGGVRNLAGSSCAAYGMTFSEPLARIDLLAHKVAQGVTQEQLVRDAQSELKESKEAARRAQKAFAIAALRADLLTLLRLSEAGKTPPFGLDAISGAQLFGAPGALERVLASPERRKEMHARAREAVKASASGQGRAALETVARISKEWREDDPAIYPAADVKEGFGKAVAALSVDAALEKILDQAGMPLLHRSGQESEDGIEAEYERGRLYLLGVEERPLLKGRAKAPQMGHLFCDVKDFTRRTAFLKEAVVADFLAREFYTPILTAAARHHHGADHLGDKGGIYLNNLLGDAVSFSGDVSALVALAHDIRRALNSYSKRLESESGSEAVAGTIAGIEERIGARRAELREQIAQAQETIRRGESDPAGQDQQALARLSSELARLDDERERELARATGEKLEAGIFISYGAAPEVATFEDHVFGSIKVAIAEKINESARGTARNLGVRARIDSILKQARATRGSEVSCPFSVFISRPLSIPVPPEAEQAVRGSLEDGDSDGAELMLQESVRQFVAQLAGGLSAGGDIYNGGAALSEDALRAYLSARGGDFTFLRRRVEVKQLHPALQDRFVFPRHTLHLVAAVSPETQSLQELYVHVGRALFKGFEKTGGLGVYEIVPPSSPFFSLLAQHHLPRWLQEHEAGKDDEHQRWEAAG